MTHPLNGPCRYNLYGDVSTRAAQLLLDPETADFFAKLIQRVAPKSYAQAMAEVTVTGRFLENFGGDSVDSRPIRHDDLIEKLAQTRHRSYKTEGPQCTGEAVHTNEEMNKLYNLQCLSCTGCRVPGFVTCKPTT